MKAHEKGAVSALFSFLPGYISGVFHRYPSAGARPLSRSTAYAGARLFSDRGWGADPDTSFRESTTCHRPGSDLLLDSDHDRPRGIAGSFAWRHGRAHDN